MRFLALVLALAPAPLLAQEDHSHHGIDPAPPSQAEPAAQPEPGPAPDEVPATTAETDHSGHQMPDVEGEEMLGSEPPPPVPPDHAADRFYPADQMTRARRNLRLESRFSTSSIRIDQLEYRSLEGRDGYAFEGEAWTGGDLDRFVLMAEGEGLWNAAPEAVELSALWRHALDPWFNLEVGVRHDVRPDPERTYAVLGIEGLAPYWIEGRGQLLVSNVGDIHAGFEASYDQRITNRLILEPEAEIKIAFQDVPELGIGGGFESVELGARLRYEFVPEFAPYVGINWERKLAGTADHARHEGESPSSFAAVVGLRAWF